MKLNNLLSAVICVDFITIVLSKVFHLGKSLNKWYAQFGIVAVLSDCLIIILGILLVQLLFPNIGLTYTILISIVVQLIHDYLFYIFVIKGLPKGQNAIIDLFKEYASESSWKILIADSLMIGSTVYLADTFSYLESSYSDFIGLLALYATTYIIYTK
jgi:hypothetical protein